MKRKNCGRQQNGRIKRQISGNWKEKIPEYTDPYPGRGGSHVGDGTLSDEALYDYNYECLCDPAG